METIYVFFADGFEDIEALTPVDVLRRSGLNVKTISTNGKRTVESTHGVSICCDALFEEQTFEDAALLILPGGMPGATNLNAHEGLLQLIKKMHEAHKPLAAICAAPLVFGGLGILKGKKATCYPGFETYLEGATYTANLVEKDDNIITGKGPGAAIAFAFTIMEQFCGSEKAKELKAGMMIE